MASAHKRWDASGSAPSKKTDEPMPTAQPQPKKRSSPPSPRSPASESKGKFIKCQICSAQHKWRNCKQTKVWDHWQDTMYDAPDTWHFEYECVDCYAARNEINKEEAMKQIKEQAPQTAARRQRLEHWAHAKQQVAIDFPSITDNKTVRRLTKSVLDRLFSPLATFIARKNSHMEMQQDQRREYDQALDELARAKTAVSRAAVAAS